MQACCALRSRHMCRQPPGGVAYPLGAASRIEACPGAVGTLVYMSSRLTSMTAFRTICSPEQMLNALDLLRGLLVVHHLLGVEGNMLLPQHVREVQPPVGHGHCDARRLPAAAGATGRSLSHAPRPARPLRAAAGAGASPLQRCFLQP